MNRYAVWVYPSLDPLPSLPADDAQTIAEVDGVAVRRTFDDETRKLLDEGGSVLLVPDDLRHSVEGAFKPCFWSYALFKRNAPPGTMGAVFDPSAPLFAAFPTEGHVDWQWWSVLRSSRPIVLDDAPDDYDPIVEMIDNIERNQRLGLVFETASGDGRLLVCTADLFEAADVPATRAFYTALLSYAASEKFDPDPAIGRPVLGKLLSE